MTSANPAYILALVSTTATFLGRGFTSGIFESTGFSAFHSGTSTIDAFFAGLNFMILLTERGTWEFFLKNLDQYLIYILWLLFMVLIDMIRRQAMARDTKKTKRFSQGSTKNRNRGSSIAFSPL